MTNNFGNRKLEEWVKIQNKHERQTSTQSNNCIQYEK